MPTPESGSVLELKETYEKFLRANGKFYEYKKVPMSPDEIRLIGKEAAITQRIMLPVIGSVALAAGIGGAWLLWERDWIFGTGISLGALSAVAIFFYLRASSREMLFKKEKVVISGVVTAKRKYSQQYGNNYKLTLSREKDVFVSRTDFGKAALGQIIQFETLSEEYNIGNSLKVLGHIDDV